MNAEEHRQTILRFVRDLTQALADGYPESEARNDLEDCIRSARIHRKLRADGAYGKQPSGIKDVRP